MTTFNFGLGPVPAHQHQHGGGWVADTAHVDASAYVGHEAQVYGSARVCDTAQVYDTAQVCGSAQVYGSARVYGSALVCDTALVYGSADLIFVGGLEFGITVTPLHATIGCQTKTHEQWLRVTAKRAAALGLSAASYPSVAAMARAAIATMKAQQRAQSK